MQYQLGFASFGLLGAKESLRVIVIGQVTYRKSKKLMLKKKCENFAKITNIDKIANCKKK